jgi:hypothetical protein
MSFAKIRPRRSTKTEWELINPILMEGELGIEYPDSGIGTGLCKFKLGDGFKDWDELPYAFNAEAAESIYGGTVTVSHDIWLRTGTSDEWETVNPVLGPGEIVFDITKSAIKIGDGEHNFRSLEYIGYSWEMDHEYDFGDIDDGPIVPGPDDKDYDFGDLDDL